jgi:hypothetical protein
MKQLFRRRKMTKILFMAAVLFLVVVIMPLATIWSLNTLFPVLAIPTTFETWVATVILGGVVGGQTGVTFKK